MKLILYVYVPGVNTKLSGIFVLLSVQAIVLLYI